VAPGAVVLAAAIPILFLHVAYQPGLAIRFGSTTINAYLSDFAVLAVVLGALAEGARRGFAPLAAGRSLWLAVSLFVVWIFAEVLYGHLHAATYSSRTHGVTAAKFAEYALLAPAVPLLLRRVRDLLLPIWSLALWSAAATVVGIAQFFGADIFLAGTVGRRQASFLASADFAALSSAALLVGIVALALPRVPGARIPAAVAAASGALGMIVAGAVASVLGLATALAGLGDELVGIRHQVHDEPDPRWLLRADVQRGLTTVGERGLVYDLLVRAAELPAAAEAARQNPGVSFVVDHLAKPPLREASTEAWAEGLTALAALPNVVCKISGLVTEADWSSWRKDELVAVLRQVLDWFGPERCLFGSDWPVCLLAAGYGEVLGLVESAVVELTAYERAAVLGGNAMRVYGLEPD